MYQPEQAPLEEKELTNYVYRELQRVGSVINIAIARQVEFLHVAPEKPREGMVYGADGTNWNPGSGQGIYAYYGGSWHKL